MFHGVHAAFRWLETPAHTLREVLEVCPSIIANKEVVITSCGSAPLRPSLRNFSEGWRLVHGGPAVHVPATDRGRQLPHDSFDEWYIFNSPPPDRQFKVFVNYGWFTVGPSHGNASARSHWSLRRMQRLFWQEMQEINVETYMACGNRLVFLTSNSDLFSAVLGGLTHRARLRRRSTSA